VPTTCVLRPAASHKSVQRFAFSIASVFLALIILTGTSPAQSESASLSGTIVDRAGALVPAADVTVVNVDTNVTYEAKTNGAGVYNFPFLKPGHYRILVTRQGFKQVDLRDVTLNVQDSLNRNFTLDVGGTSETIVVTASGANINRTDASVSTVVDRQFTENIPLNGRSFQSLITMAPGVATVPTPGAGRSGEFTVNGQRTEGNYFTVDGVSVNTGAPALGSVNSSGVGGSTPGETALGTTQSLVSVDALQEFRINTSTYSAEYGRTPGGQVSFLTRSGTNELHGSAFNYFRNEVLDANNWFNNAAKIARTAERQNDFGGSLGGPLTIPGLYRGKDRTFFFFSYEGMRLKVPQPAQTTMVPDTSLRQSAAPAIQPLLNAFPVQNGGEQGNNLALLVAAYSAPATLDSASIRVDQTLSDRVRLFGRFADSPSRSTTRSTQNLADLVSNGFDVKTLTLGMTSILSASTANEFRFNYTWNYGKTTNTLDNFGGAQPLTSNQLFSSTPPLASVAVAHFLFGSQPAVQTAYYRSKQRQWNLVDSTSISARSHVLKFGVDFRRVSTTAYQNQLVDSYFFFSPTEVMQNSGGFGIVSTLLGPTAPEPVFSNFSAYIQDEWRATNRLHFSFGLRWELNPPPGNANGKLPYTLDQITNLDTAQLAPQGTPLWKTDHHAFAPRLGLNYQVLKGQGHELILRGGVGLFYDVGNTQGAVGLSAIGFGNSAFFSGVSFPFTPSQNTLPPPDISSPYSNYVFAFDPRLTLPSTLQWNVTAEQSLGPSQGVRLSYVGAKGHDLLRARFLLPSNNPNFSLGNGLFLVTNGAASDYDALQFQFQRRLSHGLQVLTSYTWAHSIDDQSSNFVSSVPPIRGNSDFDIRHNFTGALTFDVPVSADNAISEAVLKHWSLDARVTARSALPADVVSGVTFLPDGTQVNARPDVIPGVPVYLYGQQCDSVYGATCPGGRKINFSAFSAPAGQFGNEPRNFLRGFDLWQCDLAIRREFPLHEGLRLQFRAEAFNLLNRANFGSIQNSLLVGPALFGVATNTLNSQLGGLNPLYQIGGPRSLQLALKLIF
jgi:hypothetical protein